MNRAPSPTRLYRVVEGPHAGEIVGEDDVTDCDVCDGAGEVTRLGAVVWRCPQCNGVGYVLGYPNAYEAVRLEVVDPGMEAGSPAGPSGSVRKSA